MDKRYKWEGFCNLHSRVNQILFLLHGAFKVSFFIYYIRGACRFMQGRVNSQFSQTSTGGHFYFPPITSLKNCEI